MLEHALLGVLASFTAAAEAVAAALAMPSKRENEDKTSDGESFS